MEYTYLGRTGLKVSRFCLGTMNFGTSTSEKDAFYIMDKAVDAGINFFDTADAYGGFAGEGEHGLTEKIIGKWFAQGGKRRERVILATKVFATMEDPLEGPNDEDGLSAWKVRRHMEDSLKRLQTDHVDLYYMHHIDRHVTWPEMWGVMEVLVNSGKATYIASSNFAGHDLVRAQWEADKPSVKTSGAGSDSGRQGAWAGLCHLLTSGRRDAGRECPETPERIAR